MKLVTRVTQYREEAREYRERGMPEEAKLSEASGRNALNRQSRRRRGKAATILGLPNPSTEMVNELKEKADIQGHPNLQYNHYLKPEIFTENGGP